MPDVTTSSAVDNFMQAADAAGARLMVGASSSVLSRQIRRRTRIFGPWSDTVITSPPTYSLSAGGAASTISGGVTYNAVTAAVMPSLRFSYLGGSAAVASNPAYLVFNSLHVDNSTPLGSYEMIHHGRYLDLVVWGNGFDCQVYINDQSISLDHASQSPRLQPSGSLQAFRIVLDFGSVALRTVKLTTANGFGGATVGPNDTLLPSPKVGIPRAIILGDSFTEGIGASDRWLSWAYLFGRAMGWDTWSSGSGGTGYLTTSGARGNLRSRVVADCIDYNPDVVVIATGINDNSQSPAAIRAEVDTLYDQILTSLPGVTLIVCSPFYKSGTVPANLGLVGAEIKASALARNLIYLEFLSNILMWSGSGNAGAPTGLGNSDLLVSADGTHPTQLGHSMIAAYAYQQAVQQG